ncbi:MAG: glycosyltransferase family 2 protein [Gammaproteobacteria bacterium]|nr:glycosyltransferase family 2 protein [Gammaproteobacteria bacterium]
MKLSIVSTMYQSSSYLVEFSRRIEEVVKKITSDYELIFVNDGSPDDSLDVALKLQSENSKIQVVDLSRNFGHHAAIVAGIESAKGDYVFLIDCDLEEQPEWLPMFYQEIVDSDVDVVFGVQDKRVSSWASNFAGSLFWKSLNVMSNVKIPRDPMTCRLMNRTYVDALLSIGDRVLYLAGVFAWAGFKQKPLYLVKTPRPEHHKSTYNLPRKLLQVVDSFSSFSVAPLSLVFIMGLSIWIASICYGAYLLFQKIVEPEMVLSGFTSIMLSVWFLGGFIIVALGIIGLYVAKIFQEVKSRPLYIAKRIYKGDESE